MHKLVVALGFFFVVALREGRANMPDLLGIGKLLFQLGDYAVKAVVNYANTDEGEKEWGDVVAAFVDLDLFNPSDIAQNVSVTRSGNDEQFSLEDIERLSETFNKATEQAGEAPAAVPRIVRRPPQSSRSANVDDIPF